MLYFHKFYKLNLLYQFFFVRFWVEKNVNLSNELHFSDVYRSINYIGLLAKCTWTLHATQCSLYFSKHQKNESHYLITQAVSDHWFLFRLVSSKSVQISLYLLDWCSDACFGTIKTEFLHIFMKQPDAETLALPQTDQICTWILSAVCLGKITRVKIRISIPCKKSWVPYPVCKKSYSYNECILLSFQHPFLCLFSLTKV